MEQLAALTSVLETAAFHATVEGEIIEANSPFVQLMRCMPGDDWRLNIAEGDRALLDSFWSNLVTDSEQLHQPVAFLVNGSADMFQVRAQAVTNEHGEVTSAVGVVAVESNSKKRRWEIDNVTGLPVHNAVIERFDELLAADRTFLAAVVLLEDHDAADELRRKEAARQLLSTVRPTDMLASEIDGRFLLCAAGLGSPDTARAVAARMVTALAASSITARIGLALPDHDAAAATLVREAEAGAWASAPGSYDFAPDDDAK